MWSFGSWTGPLSLSKPTAGLWMILGIILVAVLGAGYVYVQWLKRRHSLRFANMALLEKLAPKRPGPARHIPIALILVSLLLFSVALAGPTATKRIPRNKATVVLVIDVSLSMQATDVKPSRLVAAQVAAKQFVDELTPGINLGLVSFAGTASVLVSPTANHDFTKAAIDKLQLSERTATGEGIFTALQSIKTLNDVLGGGNEAPPAQIVLMSDGKQTVPEKLDDPRGGFTAAREAKARGIPVNTISFGTTRGTVDIQNDGGGTQRVAVPVDDPSLKEIAELSGGHFFTAESLDELKNVLGTLQEQIGWEVTRGDASRPWVLLGVLALVAGIGASLLLRQRLP